MKVVINKCYGGFGLSHAAILRYAELKGIVLYYDDDDYFINYYTIPAEHRTNKNHGYWYANSQIKRSDPELIQVIEELGVRANSQFADLSIVEIPDDIEYSINEYDGIEWVAEAHRTWS